MNNKKNKVKQTNISDILHIKIELHWTFILLLLFALFISAYSGWYFLLIIVLLFIMVLLHELAHSITALANNIDVKKIILLPLGGASIINLDEVKPNISLKIALAGPVMSILLGLISGLFAIVLPNIMLTAWLGVPVSLSGIFQILFILNILLGIFNLLPAFPLDGGRVLKSALEKKYNSFDATKIAVKISKILLVLFIILSIIYTIMLPGMTFSYFTFILIWDLIIVLFIYGGAQSELELAYILKYASNLPIKSALSKSFAITKSNAKLRDLYKILVKNNIHLILFTDFSSGKLKVYLVSSRLPSVLSSSPDILEKSVKNYSIEIPYIKYNESLAKAIEKMRYENASILAVIKNNKIKGLLNAQHIESIIALHVPQVIKSK
ncbi:MAG: site-2 protease family protein [Candidatus Micrarchaeia archaeon]